MFFTARKGNRQMGVPPFQRDNHYVSCAYLRRFATPDGRIETYRLLVSHPKAPLWRKQSIRGIAYRSHLYTQMTPAGPSDEVEKWLAHDFETPAETALRKAVADEQLTRDDWKRLTRFVAARDVRTPARLHEHIQRWEKRMPALLNDVLSRSIEKLERAKAAGLLIKTRQHEMSDHGVPFRVTTELQDEAALGTVKGEIVVGRGSWLFTIRHVLTHTVNALHQHRWTILKAPDGLTWFTSDNPVIRLNFGKAKYDFGGGWGNPGTEILLPVSPRHLLYTKVGERPPARGTVVSRPEAEMIRRCIAEHAHRMIFAIAADSEAPELRPRTVDADLVRAEREQWRRWHDEQATAERELMGWS